MKACSSMTIPVIDLFAGPGGLSEGFSSLTARTQRVFKVKLSIERDEHAHRTLELARFFSVLSKGEAPPDYYEYVSGTLTRDELFARHPTKLRLHVMRHGWESLERIHAK